MGVRRGTSLVLLGLGVAISGLTQRANSFVGGSHKIVGPARAGSLFWGSVGLHRVFQSPRTQRYAALKKSQVPREKNVGWGQSFDPFEASFESSFEEDEDEEAAAEGEGIRQVEDRETLLRISSEIGPTERMVLFPVFAFKTSCSRTGQDRWNTQLHGRAVNMEIHKGRRRMHTLARALGFQPSTPAEEMLYTNRMNKFTLKGAKMRSIGIDMGPGVWWGTSLSNGHFLIDAGVSAGCIPKEIPESGPPVTHDYYSVAAPDGRVWASSVYFVPPQGVSVISDIDDTIKVTQVRRRNQMFKNTFLKEFEPVSGMSSLYQYMANKGAAFHYVSNSPWQLQEDLDSFIRDTDFPQGTFHLKHLKFTIGQPRQYIINRLGLRSRSKNITNHKHSMVTTIINAFPERKFILVGDSGEKDPMIYANIAEHFPNQVEKVYIRRVEGDHREHDHWDGVFRGLEREKWTVFEHSDAVVDDVKAFFES